MIRKIALAEPVSDIVNIYSLMAIPRLGLPVVGNILAQAGYDVDITMKRMAWKCERNGTPYM